MGPLSFYFKAYLGSCYAWISMGQIWAHIVLPGKHWLRTWIQDYAGSASSAGRANWFPQSVIISCGCLLFTYHLMCLFSLDANGCSSRLNLMWKIATYTHSMLCSCACHSSIYYENTPSLGCSKNHTMFDKPHTPQHFPYFLYGVAINTQPKPTKCTLLHSIVTSLGAGYVIKQMCLCPAVPFWKDSNVLIHPLEIILPHRAPHWLLSPMKSLMIANDQRGRGLSESVHLPVPPVFCWEFLLLSLHSCGFFPLGFFPSTLDYHAFLRSDSICYASNFCLSLRYFYALHFC